MAVVQISRIQVRRGRANGGTGVPQLASGELAWAVDTQELFIGNGSVSEGAPAVGNTKILTDRDYLLDSFSYTFRKGDPTIETGPDGNEISVSLQDRLDQVVFANQFGVVGDGVTDDTEALQRAIDNLYLNSLNTEVGKMILQLQVGTYKITGPLWMPSHANIRGAGIDKTVLSYSGDWPAIRFINETSTPGNPAYGSTSTYTNQAKFVILEGFTFDTNLTGGTAILLDSVRDSTFKDISIKGLWGNSADAQNRGIDFNNFGNFNTGAVCVRNKFQNVRISGFTYGVYSDAEIDSNRFQGGSITDCHTGFGLGIDTADGPHNNIIDDVYFEDIKRYAIHITTGYGNTVTNCVMSNVGNDGGGVNSPLYPQIYFEGGGNGAFGNKSDRETVLGVTSSVVPFVGILSGAASNTSLNNYQASIVQSLTPTEIFRLPVDTNSSGYKINYLYKSTTLSISRRGTITVIVDPTLGEVNWTDEYDFAGALSKDDSLYFTAEFIDANSDSTDDTIGFYYTNSENDVEATLTYTYSTISS